VINAATSNLYTEAATTSLFTEWTLALPQALSITAGIGTSNQTLELNDRFNTALATRPDRFRKKYNGMVSPHIALNKVFAKKFSVWASYSKGYKAPMTSYFYITTPVVATTPPTPATGRVNDDLKPEVGTQFEIGTRGELLQGNLFYEVSVFNLKFANKMTAVAVGSPLQPNTTLYSYVVNGGDQLHKGLEANLRWVVYESASKLVRMVRPFTNYTYSDFKYGDNFTFQTSPTTKQDFSNKQVAAVPRHAFNAGVDLSLAHGIYANMTYNYRGGMPITSVNDYYTESYNLLNGKLGIQQNLGKHWGLDASIGINNITNTKYFIMVFANQLPDAYVPAPRNANYFGNLVISYRW
jgi:iron complex outermembrane receptor protein